MVYTSLCITLFALFGAAPCAVLTPQRRGGVPSFTSMVVFGDSFSDNGEHSCRASHEKSFKDD
jgi:phospholipase/lecithinase/hemolysin